MMEFVITKERGGDCLACEGRGFLQVRVPCSWIRCHLCEGRGFFYREAPPSRLRRVVGVVRALAGKVVRS